MFVKYFKRQQLAETLSWGKASCKAGRGMTVTTTLFYRNKHVFNLKHNKDEKDNYFTEIHNNCTTGPKFSNGG